MALHYTKLEENLRIPGRRKAVKVSGAFTGQLWTKAPLWFLGTWLETSAPWVNAFFTRATCVEWHRIRRNEEARKEWSPIPSISAVHAAAKDASSQASGQRNVRKLNVDVYILRAAFLVTYNVITWDFFSSDLWYERILVQGGTLEAMRGWYHLMRPVEI